VQHFCNMVQALGLCPIILNALSGLEQL